MKIYLSALITLAICGMILAGSCKHMPDPNTTNTPVDTSGVNAPCDPNTVYFNRDIQPLLTSYCSVPKSATNSKGCHDAISKKEGVNLSNYTSIITTGEVKAGKPSSGKMMESIIKGEMPENGWPALSSAQIAMIQKWITQGAKNNYCAECDTAGYKFATGIFPLIDKSCKACHSGTTPSGGILLTNYTEIMKVDTAVMRRAITWGNTNTAKNMPPSTKLMSCQIDNINKWINDGRKNN